MIAYDLETTRITDGSPQPLYITAYGAEFQVSMAIRSIEHLGEILETRFLTSENCGVRFIAWNGNNFDVFIIGAALLHLDRYILRPYLTRSKALRGLRVTIKGADGKPMKGFDWEFLDGISMTLGNQPQDGSEKRNDKGLKSFLKVFAPEYQKLDGPDWAKEEFNVLNAEHVRYAERDSEGLYRGMMNAQAIMMEHFGMSLYPTIGNTAIRIFQKNMPERVQVWEPPYEVVNIIRDFVMRGGYCLRAKKYVGPVWKYDLNQAYAAAMRETRLPCGRCIHSGAAENKYAAAGIYKVNAFNANNRVPFYYRDNEGTGVYVREEIQGGWITSLELKQLRAEKWHIEILDGYFWDETFTMFDYVNRLEKLRRSAPGGPSGAQGTMVKAVGNNSYGKTVETLDGMELLLSREQPEGFFEYQAESDELQHVWFKLTRPQPRDYHQPQIGSFITAHVRMLVRRGALLDPDAWVYADTDCLVFSRPVPGLSIDPSEYGKWKLEVQGDEYRFIQKKVYAKVGGGDCHAKGMNVKRLTEAEFENWFNGIAPRQEQLHRNNFIKVMTGSQMFITRVKVGENFAKKDACATV